MGILSQMISSGQASGEVIIELPNKGETKPASSYPKGVELVVNYHKQLGIESYGFYPRCDVSSVFTQEQIAQLKTSICPKCENLEWDTYKLIPKYKYFGIPAAQVLQGKYTQVAFPVEYANYDHIDYIYFPTYTQGAKDLLTQYALQEAKVRSSIEGAIEKLNKNNPVFQEFKIFSMLMSNFFDYSKETLGILKVDKYMELRDKVLKKHPELAY